MSLVKAPTQRKLLAARPQQRFDVCLHAENEYVFIARVAAHAVKAKAEDEKSGSSPTPLVEEQFQARVVNTINFIFKRSMRKKNVIITQFTTRTY